MGTLHGERALVLWLLALTVLPGVSTRSRLTLATQARQLHHPARLRIHFLVTLILLFVLPCCEWLVVATLAALGRSALEQELGTAQAVVERVQDEHNQHDDGVALGAVVVLVRILGDQGLGAFGNLVS